MMKTILLHGLGQTADDWKAVAGKISAECPDFWAGLQSNLTYSQILAELERKYGNAAEPLCLCGLSLGGMLAMDYAARHPEQVKALILMGVQYKVSPWLVDVQNMLFRMMPARLFEEKGLSKRRMIRLAHSMRKLDLTEQLKNIRCPVMIVCGEKDRPNRKAAQTLKRLLPQAELQIVPGAGHEINKDTPETVVDILNRAAAAYTVQNGGREDAGDADRTGTSRKA